ncbi:FkbM family methyltransferase [Microvirga thermotolerans]|nr:FkbM family methyltransferase [Microvirga thermotolerans]
MMTVNLRQRIEQAVHRSSNAVHKVQWGIRAAGLRNALEGSAHLLRLRLQRPDRAKIILRSGPRLQFAYPSQLPRTLVMFGDFIDPEYAFIREVARPDWTVVDVGAAIGQFSIFAARLPCRFVHAYEPSSANVATLRLNIEENGVGDRIAVHRLALSDLNGELTFETKEQTWMSGLSNCAGSGETVPVRRLSDELERLGLPHLSILKVNVAGHEPQVLAGAMDAIGKGRVDIMILLLGLASLTLYREIARQGYRFFFYHPMRRALREVRSFEAETVLSAMPWPARHIIAIRSAALEAGILSSVGIEGAI